jgi:glycolate oxidase FAD binding subunit
MASLADRDQELREIAAGAVRPAVDTDVLDGVMPRWVAEPPTPEGVAAVLAWCTRHRQSVVIRGGGTRMTWGRPPAAVDLVLSSSRGSPTTSPAT